MGSQALPALPPQNIAPPVRSYQPPQQMIAGLGEGSNQLEEADDDLEEMD